MPKNIWQTYINGTYDDAISNITIPDNKETIFIEMMKQVPFVKKIVAANNIDVFNYKNSILASKKDLNSNRMSVFNKIDSKLIEFATKIGARITMDRPGYPKELRTFEERRIDWTDNEICKAVIIQPSFRATGVDSTKWNMISIAWIENTDSKTRLQRVEDLIFETEFKHIESDIENLIEKSYFNLSRLTINDLKNN